MEKLLTYVVTVHAQIEQLLDPRKPEPTTEQLHGFVGKVVQSLKNMTAQAPPAVKEKITLSFAKHWDVANNKVGEAGITPLDLAACISAIKDELIKLGGNEKLLNRGKPTGEEAPKKQYAGETVTEIKTLADKSLVARIIGPQGSILQSLQNEFSVKLDIANELVNITGPKDGVDACMKAINDILTKGYASFTFGDDFLEEKLKIHPRQVSDLVGKGWVNVNAIKAKLGVEIGILDAPKPGSVPAPKTGPQSKQQIKKATVVIGGNSANVKKAKEVVEQLLKKFYSEITHPDMIMKEIECDWAYLNMIIGRGGSEIKHMQNSFGVNVYIPSEINGNDNIIVVGHESSVQRCEKHIASILWSAANKPQRGEEGYGGGDDDEDPQEAWMADYMYKR